MDLFLSLRCKSLFGEENGVGGRDNLNSNLIICYLDSLRQRFLIFGFPVCKVGVIKYLYAVVGEGDGNIKVFGYSNNHWNNCRLVGTYHCVTTFLS